MSTQANSLPSIVAGLALCILPCAAQNAGKVSVRFLAFPKSMEPVKVELRLAEGESVAIEASSNEFSQPMNVVPTGVWSVGETVEDPGRQTGLQGIRPHQGRRLATADAAARPQG